MSAQHPYTASNTTEILKAITSSMGIENRIGSDEDARNGAAPRVVWVPLDEEYTDPAQQRPGMKVCTDSNERFDVHLWGGDYEEAQTLRNRLIAGLYNRISRNGYEVRRGRPNMANVSPGSGFELIVEVRLLRIPIPSETYTSMALNTITGAGSATGPNAGQNATVFGTGTINV